MGKRISRRSFLKVSSGVAGIAAAATGAGAAVHPSGWRGEQRVEQIATNCEMCFWRCGVMAEVADGKVLKLQGNPYHPLTKGKLCARGNAGIGLLYDPDRLKFPQIRTGERGEGKFKRVSWDEALDFLAARLQELKQKYGPESVALFPHGVGSGFFATLMKAYGTPNSAEPAFAQCRGPREVAFTLTFGQGLGSPEAIDIENARCITLIGSHLGENMHNTQVQELATAIGRGAELVVVDPRFSVAASKAKYWLPIRPGTDIALLLAWMHVIIAEKRYDADYVAKYATGFDELAKHIADKSPEWAHPITGIKAETIRETARFIAGHRPASLIHPGRHVTWYGDDTQRLRAIAILTALLGAWGRRGGYILPSAVEVPKYPGKKPEHQPRPVADRPQPSLYPLADETLASGVCDATIPGKAPYQLKGWMVYGTNLIQSLPAPKQTEEAIQKLDFLLAIDVLPAEITGWSDVVLPESTYLERWDDVWSPAYKEPFIALRQPAVAPMYDSKPGWWIAREIANRLGLADYFDWKDPMEVVRWRIESAGRNFDELRLNGVIAGEHVPVCEEEGLALSFDTPSTKIELVSSNLAAAGFDPLPNYTPHAQPPDGMYRLLFGRAPTHTFGRMANNRLAGSVFPENEVWINSVVAKSLEVKNGDRVILENQDGVRSEPVKAKVTERIRGDCVYLVHGWGHTANGMKFARGRGASDSDLVTKYETDPIMGGTGMNVNFVRVVRPGVEA